MKSSIKPALLFSLTLFNLYATETTTTTAAPVVTTSDLEAKIKTMQENMDSKFSELTDDIDSIKSENKKVSKSLKKNLKYNINFKQNYRHYYDILDTYDKKDDADTNISLVPSLQVTDFNFYGDLEYDYYKSSPERTKAYINEAYGVWELADDSVLTVGKQKFLFSSSRLLKPTNVLNPTDYFDFLDQKTIGVWSFQYTKNWSFGKTSLIYIPFFTPSIILDTASRWIDFTTPIVSVVAPGTKLEYSIESVYEPTKPGLAFTYRYTGDSFTLGLLYFYGYDYIPTDAFQTVNSPDVFTSKAYVVVKPYYDLKNYYGLDFQKTFGNLKIGLESILGDTYRSTHPTNPKFMGNSELLNVVSLEYPIFSFRFLTEYSKKYVVTQSNITSFNRSFNSQFSGAQDDLVPTGLKNAYAHNLAIFGMYDINDENHILAGTFQNLEDKSYFYRIQYETNFLTNAQLVFVSDTFSGKSKKTFWGIFDKNDRFMSNLNVTF